MSIKRMPDKIRVDTDDLEYVKGNDYFGEEYNYLGKPFTGFEIDGYYENGQVACETEYVNGEQMGWVIEFYESGLVERETLNYGATTVYFNEFDENGIKTIGGFIAKHLLEKVCAITGEDPNNVKE